MPEEIVGHYGAILTRGLRGDLHCRLVFTNERLIVSVKGILAQIARSGGVFGAVGGAVGGAIAASQDSKSRSAISQLSPEDLLKPNKKNFEVPYSRIVKVQLGWKLGTSRLYVNTSDETYKFKFLGVKMEQVQSSIRSLLPANVSVQLVDKLED